MKRIIFLILMVIPFLSKANHWQPDPYQFESNMTVTGVLHFDDIEQCNTSIEIGAFCDEVCRGSAMVQYVESLDNYYVFMMIYGYYGDSISFKCYDHNRNIELEMICNSYIEFKSNDIIGNISEPFVFAFDSYIHNVNIDMIPEMAAIITGSGEYKKYDTCTLQITTHPGYDFSMLQEGTTIVSYEPSYSFEVLSDRQFTAIFALKEYQITLSANPEEGGLVSGSGTYTHGQTVSVVAESNDNYIFEKWTSTDGTIVSTNKQYVFDVTEDVNLVAHFINTESINESCVNDFLLYPNPATDFIIIRVFEDTDVMIYDLMGKIILKKTLTSEDNNIDVSNILNGTYIIAVDGNFKRIVINR